MDDTLPLLGIIAELSTIHVNKKDIELLDYLAKDPLVANHTPDVRVLKYPEGWFIWFLMDGDRRPFLKGFSLGFRATLAGMFTYGVRYIRLDADAPKLAVFRQYPEDWK